MQSITSSLKKHSFYVLLGLIGTLCFSSTAHAWWEKEWTVRKKVTLDTTAKGIEITNPIGSSAVLIRLHEGNFQFGAAKEDGSDLRFVSADDKTLLPYHIEKFDALMNEAYVWVKVPDVKPGAANSFWLYYGNPSEKAVKVENAKATYDPDTVLIYHLGEHNAPANDSTSQGNNAQNAGIASDGSMIATGLRFSGQNPITIPATPSLTWNSGAALTWSAWVKTSILQPNAVIFSRREGSNAFVIGLDNGVPYVEITGDGGTQCTAGGAAIPVNSWKHLAVVAENSKVTLYLDGESYATLSAAIPALNSNALIGGDSDGGTGFTGELDELEVSRVARPAGFIKLAAVSQGGENAAKLLITDQDEAAPAGFFSGGFGLFGTLFKSVTVDGWLVIGVLLIMAVISWYVMISKHFYLNKLAKGTDEFMKEWEQVASDLTLLDHPDDENVQSLGGRVDEDRQEIIELSAVYQIYHIGAREIRHRLASGKKGLSARSIQAIRASLDGGMVRQSQKVNDKLVYLTISIAGGPFLGLLGTVVGVMITFAEIAASGEVNINAIAPGIAAALIATVAGLLVAIPALFGYNYLMSRIKDVTNTAHVFIDEFVTKMAEFYPSTTD